MKRKKEATKASEEPSTQPAKTRYSDEELAEFKEIILAKLEVAKKEYSFYQSAAGAGNENGTNDTSPVFKFSSGEAVNVRSKEENSQLAIHQKKFIRDLEFAATRIENKTYGICIVTGKLIPKERLRAVPHATMSIEAKLQQPQKR